MKETLKSQVFDLIVARFPDALTNRQITNILSANEPSVRRAALELRRNGRISEYAGGYANLPIQWRAKESPGASASV